MILPAQEACQHFEPKIGLVILRAGGIFPGLL
jgi:hypothetical protein